MNEYEILLMWDEEARVWVAKNIDQVVGEAVEKALTGKEINKK
jgi:hypothetical protein